VTTLGEEPPARRDPDRPALIQSVLAAAAIVVVGVLAGLMVGGELGGVPDPTPTPSPAAVVPMTPSGTPLSIRPATPNPSPTPEPTPRPSVTVPTPGPDGIVPPIPPIEIAGADRTVIAEIGAAVDELERLDGYRFRTGAVGRATRALNGIDYGTDGTLTNRPTRALDILVGFRLVEFECSAATSSSSRIVVIGDEAWASDSEGGFEPVHEGAATVRFLDELAPAGIARRFLVPFAGGFERVGPHPHDGIEATRYRATEAGIDAYETAFGVEGTWTADAWIADAGHLLAVRIAGEGPGACNAMAVELDVLDVNDPSIVIARPS
jgi:hypothetical protein